MSKLIITPPIKKMMPMYQQNNAQKKQKKKSNSQNKYYQAPDIITQVNPSYLNNIIQPLNPHQSAFTPTNHSKLSKEDAFLLPQKSPEFHNKKTLILDLDETLVHSSFTPFENNDIILNVDFDGMVYNIYVLVRPGVQKFLKNISQFFEVIIFTASLSNYASPLLDILDSDNNIKYRLYRDHCTFINGIYIKDLQKLNRNLKDLIIVDNSPLAYAFNIDNGLPIKAWYEDKDDVELSKITKLLEFLAKTKDVRKYIKKFVKENEIIYEDAINFINNFDNKKVNNNIINNNSFVSKTNATNLDNTSNNENNISDFKNNGKKYKLNKISNLKDGIKDDIKNSPQDNIFFNSFPINIYSPLEEGSKNEDLKKNIIKYKSNQDSKNKENKAYTKSNESCKNYNINNKKTLKSDLALAHNNQIKKSIFSLHDIAVINNMIKNQHTNNFENGKFNDKFLLINNGKQKHKTNNIFRFGQKNEIKNNNNNTNNNPFNNSKFNSIIPMNITSSNTTKNLLPHQTFFKINNDYNKNYDKIPNINNNFNNENMKKLKNNYVNFIHDKKESKKKYTNLLKKYGNGKMKNYYQEIIEKNKRLLNYEKLGFGKEKKSTRLRISSSIASHRNFSLINGNKNKEYDKNFTSFHVQRSKSTGHFLKLGKQNKLSPKTPNRQLIFQRNDGEGEGEKQQKYFNLFNGFSLSNINTNKTKNMDQNYDFKFKRCKSSKRK